MTPPIHSRTKKQKKARKSNGPRIECRCRFRGIPVNEREPNPTKATSTKSKPPHHQRETHVRGKKENTLKIIGRDILAGNTFPKKQSSAPFSYGIQRNLSYPPLHSTYAFSRIPDPRQPLTANVSLLPPPSVSST